MELNTWKSGVEKTIPALEIFFKNVLLRNCGVKLLGNSMGSNEGAVEKLEESAVIIRAIEENFDTEVVFGFSEDWIKLLSKAILDVDEANNNEITQDLFLEFVTHLLQLVKRSFEEIGIDLKINEIEHIKPGKLNRALNLQKYLTATFNVDQKFAKNNGEEQLLEFALVVAQPNKDKLEMLEIGFSDENPFLNGEYEEISSKHAGYIDLDRVVDKQQEEQEQPEGSNISVKGKNVEFENFDKASAVKNSREVRNINILRDVEMNLSVELGCRELPLGKILKLVKGSVIELEKLAGEPVEILVNGHKIAKGDVVVIDEHFGVRISNMLATKEHLKELS